MLQHAILDLKVFAYNATSVIICISLYSDLCFIFYLKPSVLMADHLLKVFAYSVTSVILCIDLYQFPQSFCYIFVYIFKARICAARLFLIT